MLGKWEIVQKWKFAIATEEKVIVNASVSLTNVLNCLSEQVNIFLSLSHNLSWVA